MAIVGGGPCGLATALALHHACPGLRVGVFERAHEFRPIGSVLLASTSALATVDKIDRSVAAEMRSFENPVSSRTLYDPQGNVEKYAGSSPMFKGFVLNRWHRFQGAIARALPAGTVRLNHAFESYEIAKARTTRCVRP